MVSSVTSSTQADPTSTNAAQAPPAAQPTTSTEKAAQAKSTAAEVKDTVTISATAQAIQEANETQQQSVKEAQSGDQQAQRLVAKELAARQESK